MIVAFRIFGKRELSQLSIADLALVVLISNAVEKMPWWVEHHADRWINGRHCFVCLEYAAGLFDVSVCKGFRSLVQSEPVTLIMKAKIFQKT